jgi:hypothetical protein
MNDIVVASLWSDSLSGYGYQISAHVVGGGIRFLLRNISGATLSDSVVINFALVKGSLA